MRTASQHIDHLIEVMSGSREGDFMDELLQCYKADEFDINARSTLKNGIQYTLMTYAAMHGDLLNLLLLANEPGIDINRTDCFVSGGVHVSNSPLEDAASLNKVRCVRALLRMPTIEPLGAIRRACKDDTIQCLRMLLAHFDDEKHADEITSLFYGHSVHSSSTEAMAMLLNDRRLAIRRDIMKVICKFDDSTNLLRIFLTNWANKFYTVAVVLDLSSTLKQTTTQVEKLQGWAQLLSAFIDDGRAAQATDGTAEPPSKRARVDKSSCVICLSAASVVAVIPCGHLCLCADCNLPTNKRCPICRAVGRKLQKIYMA